MNGTQTCPGFFGDPFSLHLTNGYGSAHIILVVFDTTSANSFELAFNHWLPQVERNAPKATRSFLSLTNLFLILRVAVGTKNDLTPHRIVSQHTAEEYCARHKMKYFECSALTDDGTIATIFSTAASLRIIEGGEVSGEESEED